MNLITEDYRQQNAQLHETKPAYGTTARNYIGDIAAIAANFGCKSILDYGAGKGLLAQAAGKYRWPFKIQEYDPAVPKMSEIPTKPSDMVACIDVLEHIEPDCLGDVLDHMAGLMTVCGFLTISCREAQKTLPDGRNAHLIVKSPWWWLGKISHRWNFRWCTINEDQTHMALVIVPKKANGHG